MPTIDQLPTPALLLDLDRLEANIREMAGRAQTLGVALRPHLKTHKCVEIARRQRAAGARGITVATLFEARVFADHGFDDITWAFPIPLSRIPQAAGLADRVTLRVTVDSRAAVDALRRTGRPWHVWLKIDCGYHRAGLDPDAAATRELARDIAADGRLILDGLLSHSGHAYDGATPEAIRAVAEEERRIMAGLRERLAAGGIAAGASVGSTPSMCAAASLDGVTEARPGNYAFYDGMQVALGSCTPSQVAVSVLASVVSRGPSHAIIDAGALALSKDAAGDGAPGYGAIHDDYDAGTVRPDAYLTGVSQEHGKLSVPLPVGRRVRIQPWHSCLTAACWDWYHVVRGTDVLARWQVHRGRD